MMEDSLMYLVNRTDKPVMCDVLYILKHQIKPIRFHLWQVLFSHQLMATFLEVGSLRQSSDARVSI